VNSSSTHDRIDWRLRRARDFIYSAYAQRLDLPTISKQAQLSPFHFLRCFRSAFELTPHEYLTHLRIERAKELLASEHLPVTEVCFEVGFESLGSALLSLLVRTPALRTAIFEKRDPAGPG
jgi:AraC-like DNA-binding protein